MDLLTVLVIVLIIVVLFGGYGYRAGWYPGPPYAAPSLVGVVVAIILILVVLRLLHLL